MSSTYPLAAPAAATTALSPASRCSRRAASPRRKGPSTDLQRADPDAEVT